MRFALLGADPESLALADAAAAAGHAIVWQGDLAGSSSAEHSWLSAHDRREHWEDLVDSQLCEAIIVGRGGDDETLRARQVQDLAKLGRPLLCTFPLFDSVLTYFEIDMARADGHGYISPFVPTCFTHEATDLAAWMRGGHPEFGPVEQIQCTRTLCDRSRETVVREFARDAYLLQGVVGSIDRIGAHGAAGNAESADAAAYATLSVNMQGPRGLPIRWSAEPSNDREAIQVTLLCSRGRVIQTIETGSPGVTSAATAIAECVNAIEREPSGDGNQRAASNWPTAVRAMELADSIEISLRRGRMIDIHHRELTETLAFKGVMSALGCGVLVVLVPLAILVGWIAGLLGVPLSNYWPHALLLLLAFFLALQIVPRLISRPTPASPAGPPSGGLPQPPPASNSND